MKILISHEIFQLNFPLNAQLQKFSTRASKDFLQATPSDSIPIYARVVLSCFANWARPLATLSYHDTLLMRAAIAPLGSGLVRV